MIVLGIDPGYAIIGWSILQCKGDQIKVLGYGAIETEKKDFYLRMQEVCNTLGKIVQKYKPQQAAIEELFFNKNIKTAIKVSEMRGAIALVLLMNDIKVYDYTPLQVKQALVGYGRADKSQIQSMVKMLLNLSEVPQPDDVADALAVGICHIHSSQFNQVVKDL